MCRKPFLASSSMIKNNPDMPFESPICQIRAGTQSCLFRQARTAVAGKAQEHCTGLATWGRYAVRAVSMPAEAGLTLLTRGHPAAFSCFRRAVSTYLQRGNSGVLSHCRRGFAVCTHWQTNMAHGALHQSRQHGPQHTCSLHPSRGGSVALEAPSLTCCNS